MGIRYFLTRVSALDQNLARQLAVARGYFDIPDENVFCDKASGKDFDRPEYQRLKSIVQPGDEVIVKEFDRFGRNKKEMKRELEWFREHGVAVRILDIPTTLIDFKDQTWVLDMVNNILIEVLGTIAEQEREKIKQRQKEGIACARERGVKFGRPEKDVECVLLDGETVRDACKRLGVSKTYWYEKKKDRRPRSKGSGDLIENTPEAC